MNKYFTRRESEYNRRTECGENTRPGLGGGAGQLALVPDG